jgi:hypothetical protein
MASFWLTPAAATEDQTIARYMNDYQKSFFPKHYQPLDGCHARWLKKISGDDVQLKKQPARTW